jgi:hypothetical protein
MSRQSAYDELVAVILWIDEHSKEVNIPGEPRPMLAAGCFDMVLEHQAAIATLTKMELHGSAHALLRVMAEALFRGMYFARCAREDELSRYQRDEFRKSMEQIVRAIETELGDSNKVLSAIVESQWQALCSFTHTGYKQITRRYTGALLKPAYPEAEVIHALRFAGLIGLVAVMELAALSNNLGLGLSALERARVY